MGVISKIVDGIFGDKGESSTSGTVDEATENVGVNISEGTQEKQVATQTSRKGIGVTEGQQEREQTSTTEGTQTTQQTSEQTGTTQTKETGTETETSTQEQTSVTNENQKRDLERLISEILTTNTQTQETTEQNVEGVTTQSIGGESVIESLDEESRETIANLLQQFADPEGQLGSFISQLQERADASQDAVRAENKAILDAARQSGSRDIAQRANILAQQAGGSTLNTLVQASASELENDLAVQLAGLEAELGQRARQQQTAEYDQVLSGLSSQGSTASQIADALAGGRTATTSGQTVTGTESKTISGILEGLTTTTQDRQQNEQVLENLASMSQTDLESVIKAIREQNRDATTQSVLTGTTDTQSQTKESQFLSDIINSISQTATEEVTDSQIAELVSSLTTSLGTDAGTRTGTSTSDTKSTSRPSLFSNLIDILNVPATG